MEIEEAVIAKIEARRAKGRATYGVTMERQDLSKRQWLIHLQEEMLDAAIYLQKLIQIEEEEAKPVRLVIHQDSFGRYFTEHNGERTYLNPNTTSQ